MQPRRTKCRGVMRCWAHGDGRWLRVPYGGSSIRRATEAPVRTVLAAPGGRHGYGCQRQSAWRRVPDGIRLGATSSNVLVEALPHSASTSPIATTQVGDRGRSPRAASEAMTPLARIRRDLEARLSAAGVRFAGHPPTHSAAAFTRWMARNASATESVRTALGGA